MNCSEYNARYFFGDDIRHGVGSCMIVCAVPLLIPGVTITAVAFEDETSLPMYSAAHVFGMLLLALALLIFFIGIGLSLRIKTRITPEDTPQMISTHKKITMDDNDAAFQPHSSEHPLNVKEETSMCNENISHVNYFSEKYQSGATDRPAACTKSFHRLPDGHQRDLQGTLISGKILASDSSSDDSSDSDDRSSGSYSITEDVTGDLSPPALAKQNEMPFSYPKSKRAHKSGFAQFRTAVTQSFNITSNNFFYYSPEDIVNELKEFYKTTTKHSLQSENQIDRSHETNEFDNEAFRKNDDVCQVQKFQIAKPISEIQTREASPGRQRLNGFSSDDTSIPETPISPDNTAIVVVPISENPSHLLTLLKENVSSNASVFSLAKETKIKIRKHKPKCTKNDNLIWKLQLNHHKHLARSPYATRPFSFPLRGKIQGPSSTRVWRQPSGQKYPVNRRLHKEEQIYGKAAAVRTRSWYP